jgi:hypothetical protein
VTLKHWVQVLQGPHSSLDRAKVIELPDFHHEGPQTERGEVTLCSRSP